MKKEEIGRRIRKLRGAMSRYELGSQVGVTAQAIFNYEMGYRVPTDEIKAKIAAVFHKTVQEIFFD